MISATIFLRVAIFSRPTCFESYNSDAMKTTSTVYYSIVPSSLLDKQNTCKNFGISAPRVLLPNNVQSNHTVYDAMCYIFPVQFINTSASFTIVHDKFIPFCNCNTLQEFFWTLNHFLNVFQLF